MNDPEIRALLYPMLQGGAIVDELPIGTTVGKMTRADVVHIEAGHMSGYEIKGDNDTLKRIPMQMECYHRVFDYVHIVTTSKHLAKVVVHAPPTVGIWYMSSIRDATELVCVQQARRNELTSRQAPTDLLLQAEVVSFVKRYQPNGISKLRSWELRQWLVNSEVPLADIQAYCRERLIARMPERLKARENRREQQAAHREWVKQEKEMYQGLIDEPEKWGDPIHHAAMIPLWQHKIATLR